ncbi:hypothetical protein [Sorangium sp. So ce131]|uniref:hypothetical protein n=1 Tax=Sorangium sp. So ce131 TaxID=3133282 RepID=UPI003F61D431
MRHLLAGLLVLLPFGCSIVDPDDRAELRSRIAAMPPGNISLLKQVVMNVRAWDWLEYKDKNDQMGKLQCRYQAGGQWSDWADQEPRYTVADMFECLIERPFAVTYVMCKDEWESLERQLRETDLMNSLPVPGGSSVECRFVWDFRYEPDNVPPELIDPDEVTIDDVIDAMIGMPAPPPGWVFPELVPLLCPLGAGPGWGCPPGPADPAGAEPTVPTGAEPGDSR